MERTLSMRSHAAPQLVSSISMTIIAVWFVIAGTLTPIPAFAQSAESEAQRWVNDIYRRVLQLVTVRNHQIGEVMRQHNIEPTKMVVQFSVKRDGQLEYVRVSKSSGHVALDERVKTLIARLAPFPPIPARFTDKSKEFSLPIAMNPYSR